MRVVAQDAAPPIAPLAIALPKNTAPPTTIGGILEDGSDEKSSGWDWVWTWEYRVSLSLSYIVELV